MFNKAPVFIGSSAFAWRCCHHMRTPSQASAKPALVMEFSCVSFINDAPFSKGSDMLYNEVTEKFRTSAPLKA